MLDRMYYREWTLRALADRRGVCTQQKASVGQRLWIWFWRQCLPPHTSYVSWREV